MIHNIVAIEDKRYQAVKGVEFCGGCAFRDRGCGNVWPHVLQAPCLIENREDATSAIFKPHYKQINGKWSQEVE